MRCGRSARRGARGNLFTNFLITQQPRPIPRYSVVLSSAFPPRSLRYCGTKDRECSHPTRAGTPLVPRTPELGLDPAPGEGQRLHQLVLIQSRQGVLAVPRDFGKCSAPTEILKVRSAGRTEGHTAHCRSSAMFTRTRSCPLSRPPDCPTHKAGGWRGCWLSALAI